METIAKFGLLCDDQLSLDDLQEFFRDAESFDLDAQINGFSGAIMLCEVWGNDTNAREFMEAYGVDPNAAEWFDVVDNMM